MNNKNKIFSRKALPMAIVAVMASQASMAQETADEEVLVTGIRGSLIQSMDIKRESGGVVDAISSEDIGKFPDTNLAESLQRITGVSISRANGEGAQVTVRGFGPQFNMVTLNGRQMPNSSSLASDPVARSFNFNELAAESVKGVSVHKTGRADTGGGGLGATIDMQTARPFDYDGFKAAVKVSATQDRSVDAKVENLTPDISGMISQTFADDMFGVMLSASRSERKYHIDRIGTQNGWGGYPGFAEGSSPDTSAIDTGKNPTLNTWQVPTVDLDSADYERTRDNAQLVLQYAPTDNLTVTADYTMSRYENEGKMNRASFWFDNVESGAADRNGTIINPAREQDELNYWAWEYAFERESDSVGLNIEWDATESLSFTLDAHQSTSHSNPGARPTERIANLRSTKLRDDSDNVIGYTSIAADFSGKRPWAYYDDSTLPGGAYSKKNIEGDLYQERGYEMENTISQVQFDGTWAADMGVLKAVNFGLSSTKYEVDVTDLYSANFGLSGGAMDISGLDIYMSPGGIGFEYLPVFSADQFINMVEAQDLKAPTGLTVNGIEEDTTAAYVSVDLEHDFGSVVGRANIGARYEQTDVESYTLTDSPVVGFNWVTDLEMSKYQIEMEQRDELAGDYTNLLPNMDLSLAFLDESVVTRFSYSKTIARSNIDAMYPGTDLTNHLSTGPFLANQGNPNLKPFESDNFDFSLEYYYADGSYASAGYFIKKVDNFIASGTEDRVISGPNGPLTSPAAAARPGCPAGSVLDPVDACLSQPTDPVITWQVTTPQNLDESEVTGWEFNVQHLFGESGFGGIFNYTIVDSDDFYDVDSLTNELALEGLSDSANIVAFYEKNGFQTRLAYNWRDKFLLRQTNDEPTITAAYDQLDLSVSYDINDNINVFVDGLNITNNATERHGRWENQIVDYEVGGARYNFGVRMKF
ncbi:TonB-dependent receptor [Agaribacterium sp. ZY112]|uniref:TonB-dependent receptor n=1 Tax=Agaribacterium sp. ZY112 TaxID=3233574 RepID=UPI003523CC88